MLLQARPRGLALVADELAGLFLNMGRYSNGSDREFWLQAWNGRAFVVERQGRPPVVLDHLLVGITGGFQPDKLVRCFSGDEDGMYARVLLGWPEDTPTVRCATTATRSSLSFKARWPELPTWLLRTRTATSCRGRFGFPMRRWRNLSNSGISCTTLRRL